MERRSDRRQASRSLSRLKFPGIELNLVGALPALIRLAVEGDLPRRTGRTFAPTKGQSGNIGNQSVPF